MTKHFRFLQFLAVLVGLSIGSAVGMSCRTTPTNPDTFYERIATCTLENTSNAAAGAAVLNCLTGAVAGDYGACLAGLVTAGNWTVDEIACIVRRLATESAQRLNAGTSQPNDQAVLDAANKFIRDNNVRFR